MKVIFNFNVGALSDGGKMTYGGALEYIEYHNTPLRLPTRAESMIILENQDELKIELPNTWWTSETTEDTAWCVRSNDEFCVLKRVLKTDKCGVVLVSDEDPDILDTNDEESAREAVKFLRDSGYEVTCTKTISL